MPRLEGIVVREVAPPSIWPIHSQPEWFAFTKDEPALATLIGKCGLKAIDKNGQSWKCHRNLLRLLDERDDVRRLLALPEPCAETWLSRDEYAMAHGYKFRTTQHQALDFIGPRRAVLVGDDMRLGKTLTAIASHDPARGQFVVCAPLSARGVWLGWIRRVFPEYADQIGVLSTKKFDEEKIKKPFVFVHYDILAHWQSVRPIGTLVFDEAHMLGNAKTRRAIAASLLATNAQKILALTGTPIWDMPPDLWMLLSLLNRGGAWGDYYSFCHRYGLPVPTAHGTTFTGLSNGDELKHRMSEVMIRRRWVDVANDVPPITRSVVVAEVTQAQRNKLDVLAAKIQSERTNTASNLASYRRQVTQIKLATVKQQILKVVSANMPVIVGAWHKDNANAIAAMFPPEQVFVIHGDVSAPKRDELIDAWKQTTNGILVATMAVAQVAIDLSHARVTIVAELDFSPPVIGQFEMRAFSPDRGMDVIFVIADHFVDQRIVRVLINKLAASDPLGVAAASDAIDALRDAVLGPKQEGDLDRLLEDLLAS